MTIHVHEEAASDSDFEWVNAWAAAAATAQRAPAAAADSPPKPAGAMHAGSAPSPDAGATSQERSERAGAEQAQGRSAAVPPFETAPRRKRWTQLFRIIARASETESLAERELSTPGASQDAPSDGRSRDRGKRNFGDAMRDLSQIERDIAEIEVVRDRLLSESALASRRSPSADRFASARTSDFVPILVGGLLAFMSLVVFGAAAWFVSLR
jgi:hypothetical protein